MVIHFKTALFLKHTLFLKKLFLKGKRRGCPKEPATCPVNERLPKPALQSLQRLPVVCNLSAEKNHRHSPITYMILLTLYDFVPRPLLGPCPSPVRMDISNNLRTLSPLGPGKVWHPPCPQAAPATLLRLALEVRSIYLAECHLQT